MKIIMNIILDMKGGVKDDELYNKEIINLTSDSIWGFIISFQYVDVDRAL